MGARLLPLLLPIFTIAVSSYAPALRADEHHEIFLDADKAGIDYVLQGEYAGESADGGKIGLQVIALGDGAFHAYIEAGGLPGAGSDGRTNKTEVEGKADNDTLNMSGNGCKLQIKNGVFAGTDDKGNAITGKHVTRESPTLGAKPPADAKVLFDGTSADAWNGAMDDRKLLKWDATSKERFTNFTLHLEFILPFKPFGRGQDRGNSGVYLQNRYEIQVLDSFGLQGEKNECGAIYNLAKPLVNMCFPPLSWQTYDVDFTAGTWADGKKLTSAVATVRFNGVLVQDHTEIPDATPVSGLKDGPDPGPIYLQQHDNPVFYRNIWIIEHK